MSPHHLIVAIFISLALLTAAGCARETPPERAGVLTAAEVDRALACAEEGLAALSEEALKLHGAPRPPLYTERAYQWFMDRLWYGTGGGPGGVIATGAVPIGAELVTRARGLENLEPGLHSFTKRCPDVSMAWYGTEESLAVFVPPFDFAAFVPVGLDIPKAILPYLAAAPQANPSRGAVWSPPYTDITGKGFMVTASRPVYDGNRLLGVVGADLALRDFLAAAELDQETTALLLTGQGDILWQTTGAARLLGLKSLQRSPFLDQVQADVPAPERLRLGEQLLTRPLAPGLGALLVSGTGGETLTLDGVPHSLALEPVTRTGWRVVRLTREGP